MLVIETDDPKHAQAAENIIRSWAANLGAAVAMQSRPDATVRIATYHNDCDDVAPPEVPE